MSSTDPGSRDRDPLAVPGVAPRAVDGPVAARGNLELVDGRWRVRAPDGTTWRVGGSAEVAWIEAGTRAGTTIATAIPPVFDAYATVVVPGSDEAKREADETLLRLLRAHSAHQPWWLGYLETGVADLVFPEAPRVRCAARADVSTRPLLAGLHALGRRLEVRRRSRPPRRGTAPAATARYACGRTRRGRHATRSPGRVRHRASGGGQPGFLTIAPVV